jgi:hypothetical protein
MMSVMVIFRLGRKYPFQSPRSCLREGCGSSRIWGHGFVVRYFDDCNGHVELRRWRCPDCGTVYAMRPFGYWPRHHAPIRIILKSLCHRILRGCWDKALCLTRQRQDHRLRALKKSIPAHLGMSAGGGVMCGFHELVPLPERPGSPVGLIRFFGQKRKTQPECAVDLTASIWYTSSIKPKGGFRWMRN